jgi:hypothetical protein
MIDIKKLEKKLYDALETETKEGITEWLINKRKPTVAVKHFKYSDLVVEFINKEQIKVISICSSGKYGEGYVVFYEVN